MKNLLEIIKTNKGAIVKKTLIVGGTVLGLAIVGKLLSPSENEENEVQEDVEVEETNETTDEQ